MIIDATNLKLGRICTVAAKKALQGERVEIVNCEKAVVTGSRSDVIAKYERRAGMGNPHWGPYQPRMADRFIRRTVRGMLPYKTDRGRKALKRIMCYVGNPDDKEAVTIEEADVTKTRTLRYITIGEVCTLLGGKNQQ